MKVDGVLDEQALRLRVEAAAKQANAHDFITAFPHGLVKILHGKLSHTSPLSFYSIVLFCSVLFCSVLFCSVLFCSGFTLSYFT